MRKNIVILSGLHRHLRGKEVNQIENCHNFLIRDFILRKQVEDSLFEVQALAVLSIGRMETQEHHFMVTSQFKLYRGAQKQYFVVTIQFKD